MRPIVWTEPWYRDAHNNVRHTNLLSRFTLVDPLYQFRSTTSWQGQVHELRSGNRIIHRGSRYLMNLYWRYYAKKVRPWFKFQNLNRRYQALFCTSDHLFQIRYFKGPVIVDDDDPVFSDERINILNRANVTAVVTTTDLLRDRFIASGLETLCKVIPSGINLEFWEHQDSSTLESSLQKKAEERVVGYMAPKIFVDSDQEVQSTPESKLYSISYLIDVMRLVWDQQSDIQLWLIGQPSRAVQKLGAEETRLTLTGYINEIDLPNYVKLFDVALYPRPVDLYGRQSIKLLQYMSCEIPIVSTDVSESYIIKRAEAGLIASSPHEFAQHILDLLNNPDLRSKLAKNGSDFARPFGWDDIAERYEREVFQPLLA